MLIQKPISEKKKRNKKYYFTCCATINDKLIAETYFSYDRDCVYQEFYQKYNIYPTFLDGPFYRKIEKNKKEINRQTIKLSSKIIDAIYKEQKVKAILLNYPENYALLIGNIKNNTTKNNIVHISEINKKS